MRHIVNSLVGNNTQDTGFEDSKTNSGSHPGQDGDPVGLAGSQGTGTD